ncbi:MAG: hypothetical protein ISR78_08470 [Spirochaetia bacterium]|nr:hypothetical protein [Spirochaetia bacterium]
MFFKGRGIEIAGLGLAIFGNPVPIPQNRPVVCQPVLPMSHSNTKPLFNFTVTVYLILWCKKTGYSFSKSFKKVESYTQFT